MTCPKCKKEVPEGSTFCMHCAAPIDPKQTSYKKMAIIAIIVCIVLLGLNIFQLINNKSLRAEYRAYVNMTYAQTEVTAEANPN